MSEFLIDEKYVKDTINVSPNLDSGAIKKSIKQVHRLYIQELLGIGLVDYLQQNTSLTSVYTTLLPDVKYYFALLVQYDLLSTLGIKTTNKSTALVPDNTADVASIKMEMKYIQEKFILLKADILAYLNRHATELPEYIPQVRNKTFNLIAFTAIPQKYFGG